MEPLGIFLPVLASNQDLTDLSLPNSYDYRHETAVPGPLGFITKVFLWIRNSF
jgi:hypothetical protein